MRKGWLKHADPVPHPTKHKKRVQNDHQTVSFCNGLGSLPNLGISRHFGTTGWLESNNAFKPTFSRRASKSAFKPTFSSL